VEEVEVAAPPPEAEGEEAPQPIVDARSRRQKLLVCWIR